MEMKKVRNDLLEYWARLSELKSRILAKTFDKEPDLGRISTIREGFTLQDKIKKP